MAVKIRLKRLGKVRVPQFRIVVVDSRKKRDGRVIEEIGKYHPKEEPSFIEVSSERAQYWLGVGAQPSDAVAAILKLTGDWQKFKGLPGTEGTLKSAEPKRDKLEIFNEALKEAANEPKSAAVTSKKKSDKSDAAEDDKSDDKKADKADKSEEKKAESSGSGQSDEAPAANETPADEKPEVAAEAAEAAEGTEKSEG